MIKLQNLSRSFGHSIAVERISFTVESGEVFGFLGPNGAGKTTTVRMLIALIAPSSGRAWVAGHQVGRQDAQIRRKVGILTESPGLYDRLSAERNLAFFARLYEVQDVARQVEHYLRLLGLWDRRSQLVGAFSKGMRQKLAIARALLHEPPVLFLDEPTSSLDPEAALVVREFIADLRKEGRTIFICTHNLNEADRLCDRIGVINTRLLALDTPIGLRRKLFGRTVVFHLRHFEPQFAECLRAFPEIHFLEVIDNRLLAHLDDPEGFNPILIRALVEKGAEIQFVGELRRSLEEVYLQLVNQSKETREVRAEQGVEARPVIAGRERR